jgi:hypothetical protein
MTANFSSMIDEKGSQLIAAKTKFSTFVETDECG